MYFSQFRYFLFRNLSPIEREILTVLYRFLYATSISIIMIEGVLYLSLGYASLFWQEHDWKPFEILKK